MSTSGVVLFNPVVADFVDEAWERIGKNPRQLTIEHLISTRRSMNFMLKHWATKGVRQWAMEEKTIPTTVGMQSFAAEVGTVDIFSMQLERDSVVTPMVPIARTDYHAINDKAMQGRPDRYFIQRGRDTQTVFIWQAGENTTDTIRYWRMRQLEIVGRASNNVDIPSHFIEAFAACLAAKLAEKWAPDKEAGLVAKADLVLSEAITEDRERAPVEISVSYR